jgi:dienelactone hydrolase
VPLGALITDLLPAFIPLILIHGVAGAFGRTNRFSRDRRLCRVALAELANVPNVREERTETDGIPARLYDPGEATALLLLGHGGGHGKDSERFVYLSRRYAEATGLAVLCIDAVDHGERKLSDANPNAPRRWHSNAVDRMVQDWRTTVDAFSSIGPPIAYVGFSMGAIFGLPTVAAMPSMKAAVFAVGGIPTGGGIDDPQLGSVLLDAAATLKQPQVLMLNMTGDKIFSADGTRALFDGIPGRKKRLMFWEGDHDDWPPEMISQSVTFINEHIK